jgi:hypothetical protein
MVLDFGLLSSNLFNTSFADGVGFGSDGTSAVLSNDIAAGTSTHTPTIEVQSHPGPDYTVYDEIGRFTIPIQTNSKTCVIAWRYQGTMNDTGDVSDTGHYRLKITSSQGDYLWALGSNGSPGTSNFDVSGDVLDIVNGILAAGFPVADELVIIVEAAMSGDGTYGAGQMGVANSVFQIWVVN